MKLGFITIPFAIMIFIISLYIISTSNMIPPMYKEGINIIAAIVFVIYLIMVVFPEV